MITTEIRYVTFDVGETLVDETRMSIKLAQVLGVFVSQTEILQDGTVSAGVRR